jgi:hypothetical protein
VSMQELTIDQLRTARDKCDSMRTGKKRLMAPRWSEGVDSTVVRLMLARMAAKEFAGKLSATSGLTCLTAKQVSVRWHNVLKSLSEKVCMKKDAARTAVTSMWARQ